MGKIQYYENGYHINYMNVRLTIDLQRALSTDYAKQKTKKIFLSEVEKSLKNR